MSTKLPISQLTRLLKITQKNITPSIAALQSSGLRRHSRRLSQKLRVYFPELIAMHAISSGATCATATGKAATPFGFCSGEMTTFQLVIVTMSMPKAKRQNIRWRSNGKGWRSWIDQAKAVEEAVGPAAFASEPSVMERPLTVPRSDGSTALLVARETLMNTYWRGGKGGVPRQWCHGVGAGATV